MNWLGQRHKQVLQRVTWFSNWKVGNFAAEYRVHGTYFLYFYQVSTSRCKYRNWGSGVEIITDISRWLKGLTNERDYEREGQFWEHILRFFCSIIKSKWY